MTTGDGELREVADGDWAWLQLGGGWGWSNAGLVTDGDRALLVDTLFDLPLTARMLGAMRAAAPGAEIGTLVNTHANGDHCYGNELLAGAEIVASRACAEEMLETPPEVLAGFVAAAPGLGELGAFVAEIFGPFAFDGITLTPPTRTFDGALELRVGDRAVHLLEVGPAHTRGDVVVHVPDSGVVFTGDIVFNGMHPVVWAGPVRNWIDACERVLALEPTTVVPGHGPVGDANTIAAQRDHLEWLLAESRPHYDEGRAPLDAARALRAAHDLGGAEAERLVVNVTACYRDFGGDPVSDVVTMFTEMAALAAEPLS